MGSFRKWTKGLAASPFGSPVERAHDRLGSPADVLVSHGIRVRRNRALCPFHSDKDPSLHLYRGKDGRGRWHCFVCDLDDDALGLEARLSNVSVQEVIARFGRN